MYNSIYINIEMLSLLRRVGVSLVNIYENEILEHSHNKS